ncbi:MAG: sugar phosphate isomerase/epimerase [Bacteroidetes bacterium]|nr:sugar phosphate isomerase/epimerase [Bacteroidota bacterium]
MKIVASVTPNKTQFGPLLYAGELDRALAELAEIGYDGIELSLKTPFDVDRDKLYKNLEMNGLVLASIATGQSYLEDGLSLFHWEKDKRKATVARIKEFIDIVSPVGGSVILGGIKGRLDGINDSIQYAYGCDSIKECVNYAEKKNVVLLLESINRYESNIFNTQAESRDLVEAIGSSAIKVLSDTFHMNIEEVSIINSLTEMKESIGVIHCADSNRLAPGMGHIDFSEILQNLNQYTSLQYLGVEVLPLPDSRSCAEQAMAILKLYVTKEED